MLECPEDAWDKIFEINVKVSFLLFKECVPHMKVDKPIFLLANDKFPIAEKRWRISYIYQLDWRLPANICPGSVFCEQDSSDRSH